MIDDNAAKAAHKACVDYNARKETEEITRLRADLAAVTEERDRMKEALKPDEAMAEIVARAICLNRAAHACNCKENGVCKAPVESLREHTEVWPQARAAIAAIRPHIEAAERERCANVAELCWTGSPDEIAAAIRRGK